MRIESDQLDEQTTSAEIIKIVPNHYESVALNFIGFEQSKSDFQIISDVLIDRNSSNRRDWTLKPVYY